MINLKTQFISIQQKPVSLITIYLCTNNISQHKKPLTWG